MNGKILYYEKGGKHNTGSTLNAAKERSLSLGIKKAVIATTHGYTALEAIKVFSGTGIEVIAVGLSHSCGSEGWVMTQEEKQRIEEAGAKVLVGLHSLSRGVSDAFGCNISAEQVVAQTLYMFSQGMKVAVEVAIMAAEAGLVKSDEEIIAAGGSSEGCDTAIVLTPSFAWKLKDLKIHEIICKPREP